MADISPKQYQKLPGTGYRRMVPVWAIFALLFVIGIFALLLRGRRTQLWLGSDQLLMVDSDGAREYYKRFNYGDIQWIVIRKTMEGKIANVLYALLAAFFALLTFSADSQGLAIFWGIVTGAFAIALATNVFAGPTCKCQLRTAVQTEELLSLNRIKNASKALARLRPLILAAQGQLTQEEVSTRFQETSGPAMNLGNATLNPAPSASPDASPPVAQ